MLNIGKHCNNTNCMFVCEQMRNCLKMFGKSKVLKWWPAEYDKT